MKYSTQIIILATIVLLIIILCQSTYAQWSTNSNFNNAICTATGDQTNPMIISDGTGGAIITWQDRRSGNYDIYAQRISAAGTVQWKSDGVPICTATVDKLSPTITSDGSGGAIITWSDSRSSTSRIYAQRISASGIVQWKSDGVAICTATDFQYYPTIVSDGAGGTIITWTDDRSGNFDIYAQHVNSAGVVQWTNNGIAICTSTGDQTNQMIISDGMGGAIITWEDYRSGSGSTDIYAQHINSVGTVQWTSNGVAICTASDVQYLPTNISDGAGGAIITWYDYRSGNYDIYAQRISAAGAVQWTSNGVAICTATSVQINPTITIDGAGGAIITWYDLRSSSTNDIYAQRISAAGAVQWTGNGVAICTATGDQYFPYIISDGAGGAIITWEDLRNGSKRDIYAQRISAAGAVQWAGNGVAICTSTGDQTNPMIISDGAGGTIITWKDYRNSSTSDIYAQKVDRYGYLGNMGPKIQSVKDVKSDQGGRVAMMWNPSPLDTWPQQTITSYIIYRGVKASVMAKITGLQKTMKTEIGGEAIYWENVGTVPAHWLSGYSYSVPTLSDSTAKGNPMYYFMVTAATTTGTKYWESLPDSGYSVDNIPPTTPAAAKIASSAGGAIQLVWDKNTIDPDVDGYIVNRSESSGFQIADENKLDFIKDTFYVDHSTSYGHKYYYRITTVDIHGNQSTPSEELSATALEDGNNLLPSSTALLQNYPNPFNPSTIFKYNISTTAMVSLRIYDLLGREVATLVNEEKPQGAYTVSWNAANMPSGVYIYQLKAGSFMQTKKLMLLK